MPLRLLRYVVRVWEGWLREHSGARRIPAVIPMVVHQGPKAWTGPTRLSELYDLPGPLLLAAGRHLPELELALHDLGVISPQTLVSGGGPAVARLALLLLKAALGDTDLASVLEEFADTLRELYREPRGRENLRTLAR